MKKQYLIVMLMLLTVFGACKKETLTINKQKLFEETNVSSGQKNWLQLRLYPSGKAELAKDGKFLKGTFSKTSSTITVDIEGEKYVFKILSSSRLSYNDNIILELIIPV